MCFSCVMFASVVCFPQTRSTDLRWTCSIMLCLSFVWTSPYRLSHPVPLTHALGVSLTPPWPADVSMVTGRSSTLATDGLMQ